MSNNDCIVKEVVEPSLVIDIEESLTSLVEIECPESIIEIEECCTRLIEIETGEAGGIGDVEVTVEENTTCIIEIEQKVLSIEFIESVIINEGDGGGDTDNVICELVAGETITVNHVVAVAPDGTAVIADKDDPATYCNVIGISRQSAAIGSLVQIVKFGKLSGAAIGSIGENFFLGNNGQITSTIPTTGAWMPLGQQLTPFDLMVKIEDPIIR